MFVTNDNDCNAATSAREVSHRATRCHCNAHASSHLCLHDPIRRLISLNGLWDDLGWLRRTTSSRLNIGLSTSTRSIAGAVVENSLAVAGAVAMPLGRRKAGVALVGLGTAIGGVGHVVEGNLPRALRDLARHAIWSVRADFGVARATIMGNPIHP